MPWAWLRWVLLIAALYGVLWIGGLIASLKVLPHQLEAGGVRLRHGNLAEVLIPYHEIADVEQQSLGAPGRARRSCDGPQRRQRLSGRGRPYRRHTPAPRSPLGVRSAQTHPTGDDGACGSGRSRTPYRGFATSDLTPGPLPVGEGVAAGQSPPHSPLSTWWRGGRGVRIGPLLHYGTMAARSTWRSAARAKAVSRSARANRLSTMSLKGSVVRLRATKSSAWTRCRGW